MNKFWYEKWINSKWAFYIGVLYSFRIGIVVGSENTLYLGLICIGIDRS